MDSTPRKTGTAFEYFLYTAILMETGLAAMIYKTLFRTADLERMQVYFAIFYFGFLGWAISQLNKLHRSRRELAAQSAPVSGPEAASEDTRPVLGLTGGQIVIIVVVFATAVAGFTWVLKLVN
jgi:hypothetical protein